MTHENLRLLFTGSVWALFLLNAVQWGLYRQRIYGLFTLHTFSWLTNLFLFDNTVALSAATSTLLMNLSMGFFKLNFLELVLVMFTQRGSAARRWIRVAQALVVAYVLGGWIVWQPAGTSNNVAYEVLTHMFRILAVLINLGAIWLAARRRDSVGRLFLAGSTFMTLRGLLSVALFSGIPWGWATQPVVASVNLVIQGMLMAELLCFSLCLTFLRRSQEVAQARQQAITEQELVSEREQRQRESLEAELAVRRLEQEKMAVQLRALQGQVNPHFLFNSLNTLSSLIDDSPRQAGEFVDELSSVYRYLLRANDNPLITLRDELDFIRSYYHLLQTRHGKGIDLRIAVDDRFLDTQLPPLTLQLLVENAVKHNVVLPDQPLTIAIATNPDGQLVVQNNLQRKASRVLSNGIGLSNILTQYRMLGQGLPTVHDGSGEFVVILPLVATPASAG
ncbi:sensor histidine kinase [Fibrisoma montanum]|nr:histidine kinase [Fibrisoma montanum]